MSEETIGSYRLVRELGSGGMGTVYEAIDIMLERSVAIKMLRPEIASKPDLIERFRAEAVTLAKLHHPAVATLFAFLREGERFAMVMEFVRGRTLETMVSSAGRLPPALAADVLRQTLDGVAHAHGMGVLHRDIKPANIMIKDDGTVKVTDFGIARILGASRMTREGRIIGTLEYIAPERIRGDEEDLRSDLYSAGVVLFELLTGRLPFVSDTDFGLIEAHLRQPPPALSALGVQCPETLQSIVGKALAKAPKDRYQSALEFRDALAAFIQTVPVLPPTRLAERPGPTRLAAPRLAATRPVRRWRDWAVVAAALVLVTAAAGSFAIWRLRDTPAKPAVVAAVREAPAAPPVQQPEAVPEALVFLPPTHPAMEPQKLSKLTTQRITPEAHATPAAPKQAPVTAPAPVSVAVPVPPPVAVAAAPEVRPAPAPAPPPKPSRHKDLQSIRSLYIEKMEDQLDDHIKDEIRKQLPALRLVAGRADADAVMRGTVEKRGNTGSRVTRGYLGIKSEYSATVTITDIEGIGVLWSGDAGDARALVGAIKRGGPKRVAERIVGELRKAMAK